jgi:ADP-ribose pyrophosphatase YjhB (NUDIX family)
MNIPSKFNVRVYFLLISEDGNQILLADEIIGGRAYTKFPGGGLEFGEGPEDCVRREAIEELGQEVEIKAHFYTTGFFIQSAFRPTDQVLSIYYTTQLMGAQQFRTTAIKHDFSQSENDEESFRWVNIRSISKDDFDFPADQYVAQMLTSQTSKQGE